MRENNEPERRRELAHPRVVLAWLVLVTLVTLAPLMARVLRHFAH